MGRRHSPEHTLRILFHYTRYLAVNCPPPPRTTHSRVTDGRSSNEARNCASSFLLDLRSLYLILHSFLRSVSPQDSGSPHP